MQLVVLLLRALREPLKCEYTQQQNEYESLLAKAPTQASKRNLDIFIEC